MYLLQRTIERVTQRPNVMRRAVHHALAVHDTNNHRMKVLSQRRAFHWLPVAGTNDLTHGSWFVFS